MTTSATTPIRASAADVVTITQLVLHERRGRDRGWWDRMRAAFWPEATVTISWYTGPAEGFIAASEAMSARGGVATHRLAPIAVDVAGDRALAEAPAVIEIAATIDGIEVLLSSYARLQYRAERRSGEWRLLALDAIYERDGLTPAVPGETVRVDAAALAPYRPPYRLLAWILTARGQTVGDDMLGEDRPAAVTAFYESEHRWLHSG